MANPTCERWKDLLRNQNNRGQIYNDFLVDRVMLTEHLSNCQKCQNRIAALKPDIDIIPDDSMTDQEFSLAIRELWNLARQKNQTP